MAKDLCLAQAAAAASGQEKPLGAEAARGLIALVEGSDGDLRLSAVYPKIRTT